jgi:hypothetical protein
MVEEKSDEKSKKKKKTPNDYTGYSTEIYAEFANMEKKKE